MENTMQPTTITLAVDELNDTNTVDHVYTRFDLYQNRSVYIGASHQSDARDLLTLYRTFPKVSGNFKGVNKTAFKFAIDHEVDGVDGLSQLIAPVIFEGSFSIPVGVTAAEQLIMRQSGLALLDLDAVMVALNNQLVI
jgi:hypothetical protein